MEKLTIQDALEKDKSQYPHALFRSIPPKLCFFFFLRPVPPWVSLLFAGGKVKHLPLSWSKSVSVFTLLESPSYFSPLLFFLRFRFFSVRLDKWASVMIVFGRAARRRFSGAPLLLAAPSCEKDAEGVKPGCKWCWVRAGEERFLQPKINSPPNSVNKIDLFFIIIISLKYQKLRFPKRNIDS